MVRNSRELIVFRGQDIDADWRKRGFFQERWSS